MFDDAFCSHIDIIGFPILLVNRQTDNILGHDSDMSGLGKRLREARGKSVSQAQLAKDVKVSQATISDLETGVSATMAAGTLIAICARLKIRPRWLLYGQLPQAESDLSLSDDEIRLIVTYRGNLTASQKLVVQRFLDATPEQRDAIAEFVLGQAIRPSAPPPAIQRTSRRRVKDRV